MPYRLSLGNTGNYNLGRMDRYSHLSTPHLAEMSLASSNSSPTSASYAGKPIFQAFPDQTRAQQLGLLLWHPLFRGKCPQYGQLFKTVVGCIKLLASLGSSRDTDAVGEFMREKLGAAE